MTDDRSIGDDDHPTGDDDPTSDDDHPTGDGSRVDTDPATAGGHGDPATSDPVLDDLFAVIEDRKATLPEDSYTASLFDHEKGEDALLEKLGEETTELVLAAKNGDGDAIAHESADLVYHLLVLLAMYDLDLDDLRAELQRRR